MTNYSSKQTCPVCGSNEIIYYCKGCNRYWCEDLGCPNAPSIISGTYGNHEWANIKECKICKKEGIMIHKN